MDGFNMRTVELQSDCCLVLCDGGFALKARAKIFQPPV